MTMLNEKNQGLKKLNERIIQLIDEFSLVQFHPINPNDPDTIDVILQEIDNTLQFDEDQEIRIDCDSEM